MDLLTLLQNKIESDETIYKVLPHECELVYLAIEKAEYLKAGELALKALQAGRLDVKYIVYYLFSICYQFQEAKCYIEYIQLLQKMHTTLSVCIKAGKIKIKQYAGGFEWLHQQVYALLEETKGNMYLAKEQKDKLLFEVDEYISIFQSVVGGVETTLLAKLKLSLNKIKIQNENEILTENCLTTVNQNTIESCNNTEDNLKFSQIVTQDAESDSGQTSQKWQLLKQKIAIYESLVDQKQWLLATIAHRKLSVEIDQFDPVLYLPGLFYGYLTKTASFLSFMDKLLVYQDQAIWTFLEKIFESNPKAFSGLDSEIYLEQLQKKYNASSNTQNELEISEVYADDHHHR